MLDLQIKCGVLEEKSVVRFAGAAMELTRYREQEIQVNTYIYLENDGRKYQFITFNHCDASKNISLEKRIVCEETEEYSFPSETRKNQIIYYLPQSEKQEVMLSKLTRRREQEDYDGAFPGQQVLGSEYFAWLREPRDYDYVVLLPTKNLRAVYRPEFMRQFGIDVLEERNGALFKEVFAVGANVEFCGAFSGIVKISDIYAVETMVFIKKDDQKYIYRCLEKFDECREEVIRNTRFYRETSLSAVKQFEIPEDTEYAMLDCYLPADEKVSVIKELGKAQYGRYVPFEESEVAVHGCRYFSAVVENFSDRDSENVVYITVEACRRTRYKKLRNML